jgi:hypothetical protein
MIIGKVKPILKAAMLADDSVLLEGPHGIGKSEIVKQYCEENDYFYTALFLSHQEVGDLIGIPVTEIINNESVTLWSKPIWLQRMERAASEGKRCILLMDELNRAQTDVLNSALQLVLERQIHEHKLPIVDGYRTQIIACTNPADGDIDYQVQSLDLALVNRFLKIEVEVDNEGWLKWARENKVNKIIRDFIMENESKLYFIPEDSDVGATPRSWTKLAKFVDLMEKGEIPEDLYINIIRGKIGAGLASQFYTFYMTYSKNISTKDIISFIKKSYKQTNNIIETGDDLKEYLSDIENIQKLEHTNTIFGKYKNQIADDNTIMTDILPIYGILYSLEIETLTSFLKDKKANEKQLFYSLMKKDIDKNLANKIKSKVIKHA